MSDLTSCELHFMCRRQWETLQSTQDPEIRYCNSCSKNVFALRTHAEFSVACAVGRCVAIMDANDIVGRVGEPEGSWDWMEAESETIQIRFDQSFPLQLIARLRQAFPRVTQTDTAWQPGIWITLGHFTPYVAQQLIKELDQRFPAVEHLVSNNPSGQTPV